jgi:peptidoglycan/xylan/chitin deacetylase (PgdA/CDA1 family)
VVGIDDVSYSVRVLVTISDWMVLMREAYRILTATRRFLRRAAFSRTVAMRNRRAIVSFTFDDFPRSAVVNGARLLEDHGVRGTFYMTGSYCGGVIDGIPQYCEKDLAVLAAAGHEIGCHTFSHRRVSTLSAAELNRELDLNEVFAARHLPGIALRTFAYPFGDVSFAATMRLQSRFAGCRSIEPGYNSQSADLGRLRSVQLYDRLVSAEDVSDIIKQAVMRTAWLIFYTHDVTQSPSSFGCTPSLFEHAIKFAIAAGAEIRPMLAAIEAVTALR